MDTTNVRRGMQEKKCLSNNEVAFGDKTSWYLTEIKEREIIFIKL